MELGKKTDETNSLSREMLSKTLAQSIAIKNNDELNLMALSTARLAKNNTSIVPMHDLKPNWLSDMRFSAPVDLRRCNEICAKNIICYHND